MPPKSPKASASASRGKRAPKPKTIWDPSDSGDAPEAKVHTQM